MSRKNNRVPVMEGGPIVDDLPPLGPHIGSGRRRPDGANAGIPSKVRRAVYNRDDWTCQECGIDVVSTQPGEAMPHDAATVDHVIPVVNGGTNRLSNLKTYCITCNQHKADK